MFDVSAIGVDSIGIDAVESSLCVFESETTDEIMTSYTKIVNHYFLVQKTKS